MQASVRRNLSWMLAAQGCLVMLQFGSSVFTARLLSPQEMGVFAIGIAIMGILGAIRVFGLANFLICEPQLDPFTIRSVFTINAALAAATATITLLVSNMGANLLSSPGVQQVLKVLALIPLIGIFEFLPATMLEREGAFRTLAFVNVARSMVATAVTVTLAYNGFSYMSMAWGNLSAAALSVIYLATIAHRHVSFRVGFRDWRRITRFGMRMLTISLAGNLALRLSELMLGRIAGLAALGLYSRASGLNNILWESIHGVIGRIVFVDFSEHKRRSLSLRKSYLRIVAMVTGLLWPAFGGLAVISGPLIRTLYGASWVGAAAPLSLLSIASGVMVSATMAVEVYIVCGESRKQVRFEIKRTLTGLILFTFGCFGGLIWASAARVADSALAILYCKSDLEHVTETVLKDYWPIYLQSALLALLACCPVAVLMVANGWSAETPFPAVLGGVGVGLGMWLAGLWSLGHPIFVELLQLLRWFRGKSVRSV